MIQKIPSSLAFFGVLLIAMGLVIGFGIHEFRAPRLGLSAHFTAMQSGVALIAFGLLWPKLTLWRAWSAPLAYCLWISLYLVCLGLLVAALWGVDKGAPIEVAGRVAAAWQIRTSGALITLGSLGSLVAIVMILVQWRWVRD